MKKLLVLVPMLFAASLYSQDSQNCPMHKSHTDQSAAASPYAGLENQEYKTLTSEEVTKYRNGEGMGLAKAAELNHYPGPKHLLELSQQLNLTPEQKEAAQNAYDTMHQAAVELGNRIIAAEKELDQLFARQETTSSQVQEVTDRIARLQGELRFVHLSAHLQIREQLSAEQISQYAMLRGYHHH